jgi:predicted dehydrogenase
MTTLTPFIYGKGRAGLAIAKSLASLALQKPSLNLAPAQWLERGADLKAVARSVANPVFILSNPHGLHAEGIRAADAAGFKAILCEKPACVNLEQLETLRGVKTPTAVFHVYRAMWGVQTLKQMIDSGEMGDIITIEGRYWQSSTADRALIGGVTNSWKNDPKLSGESDTYLDVGTHWIDAVSYLFGSVPSQIQGWRSYANAETAHRDSHVQVTLHYSNKGRAFGSISKTVHGAPNHFEINVLGTKKSATWKFLEPDEIFIGEGKDRRVVTRKTAELGSLQSAFHAMGWKFRTGY